MTGRRVTVLPGILGFLFLTVFVACGTPVTDPPVVTPEPETVTIVETLFERYVEWYDPNVGPLKSWVYDTGGKLLEHSVYQNTDGRLTEVSTYSSGSVTDGTTLVSRLSYTYDDVGNATHGEVWNLVDGVLTLVKSFDATYNSSGMYLDYLEKDDAGVVVEHRVCNYDASGLNYLTETYYADAATANKIEEYVCSYDTADPTKYVKETHYLKVTGQDPSTLYERNLVHHFVWNGTTMYQQTDFDETGTLISAILYTFEDGLKKSRSALNQDGKLTRYRLYQYDSTGFLTELKNLTYADDPAGQLELRESSRLYTEGANQFYEKCLYTGVETNRNVLQGPPKATWRTPAPVHHRDDF